MIVLADQFAAEVGAPLETVLSAIKSGRITCAQKLNGRWAVDLEQGALEFSGSRRAPRIDARRTGTSVPEMVGPGLQFGDGDDSEMLGGLSPAQIAIGEKFWKMKLAELNYRTKLGQLIPIDAQRRAFVDAATAVRVKLLGIPSRMRQRLGLSDEGHTLCDQLIREALEDMSRMDPITVDPDSDDSSVPDVIDS